jgi:hypothetical protein
VVGKVIEGAYEVLGIFDRVEEKREAMQSLLLPPPARKPLPGRPSPTALVKTTSR